MNVSRLLENRCGYECCILIGQKQGNKEATIVVFGSEIELVESLKNTLASQPRVKEIMLEALSDDIIMRD